MHNKAHSSTSGYELIMVVRWKWCKIPIVDILGIKIDDRLKCNLHIDRICLKSANHLNALVRLKRFLGNEERKVLINSFVLSNFSYCPLVWMSTPLVWMSTNAKSAHKIEAIQKRALCFMLNDYESSYEKSKSLEIQV